MGSRLMQEGHCGPGTVCPAEWHEKSLEEHRTKTTKDNSNSNKNLNVKVEIKKNNLGD